ncbi:hypothetical protein JXB11_04800 [Candidatus Woesearchaeota archaeon]|nr:hypothetical protein [Candidatus Woesearchaeota archaeon]
MKREYLFLGAIFAAVFAARLYFSFKTPHFSYDGYFALRQVSEIIASGVPSFNHLSYSEHFFLPAFHYVLAGFSFIFPPQLVLKIVPNIFASSLVIVAYLLSYEITKHRSASLFAAIAAGFIPVYFSETLNSISVHSFTIPLSMFLLYAFLKTEKKGFIVVFVSGMLVFALTDASAIIFILGLLFYMALAKVENLTQSKSEVEVILFSSLFVTWLLFLAFKAPLLEYGIMTIWQNIPEALISARFVSLNPIEAVYYIGLLPFFAGVFVIYRYMFREKLKQIYLLMSFALVIFLMLWLQLVELKLGLFFLGSIIAVLFGQFYVIFSAYIDKTKAAGVKSLLISLFAVALVLSLIWPSFSAAESAVQNAPSDEVISALEWARENTENDAVILAPVELGHLVTAVANRHNVIDTNFLFATGIEQRFSDFNDIYFSSSETDSIRLLNKYGVDYIIPIQVNASKKPVNLELNKECFKQVYYPDPGIYKSVCDVN